MSKVFREDSPLTLVNGTQQTTWFPRRMDLPPLAEPVDCASEGGTFRESAPARVPRNRAPIFKTSAQKADENSFVSPTWRESLIVLGTPAGIFLCVFAVWVYLTWWA